MNRGRSHTASGARFEIALCAVIALAYVAPLALTRYFPGLDLPWHAAIIEVMGTGDPTREFLGYFTVDTRFSSYLTLYWTTAALAHLTGDVAIAMQGVIALYVATFAAGTYRLARAFGHSGACVALAMPAAYSLALEFGFLAYALAYPMTLYLWALVRECMTRPPHATRYIAAFLLSAVIAITHPFAAALAFGGAAVLVATHIDRASARQAAVTATAVLTGVIPVVWAFTTLSRDSSGRVGPQTADVTTQQFTSPVESVLALPRRLFGFVGPTWAAIVLALGLCAAVLARRLGETRARDRRAARDRALLWLACALGAVYLVTPFTFEWPRYWYVAQPRVLPLVWVVVVVALAPAQATRLPHTAPNSSPLRARARVWAAPLGVCALAWGILTIGTFVPFASEASDFRAVITRSAPHQKTLGLIEQPRVIDREPPSPWRNAPAYVLVERGGFVSGLPMTTASVGNAGILVPVRRADNAPAAPRSPHPGFSRTFAWERHASGWDQFLIRDRDPAARFDYFREHAGKVRLIAEQGQWRLFARRTGESSPENHP